MNEHEISPDAAIWTLLTYAILKGSFDGQTDAKISLRMHVFYVHSS